MSKNLFKTKLVNHDSIYTFYRNSKRVKQRNKIVGRADLKERITKMCEILSDSVLDSEGGVYVDRLGYFFMWMLPRKRMFGIIKKEVGLVEGFNSHTDQHIYVPVFYPVHPRQGKLRGWSMDRKFHRRIKKGLSERLKSGWKYNMYAETVRKTFK